MSCACRRGSKRRNELHHDAGHVWAREHKAPHRHVTDERVRALTHRRLQVLEAHGEQREQVRVRRGDEQLQLHSEPLREPQEQVKHDDEERLVSGSSMSGFCWYCWYLSSVVWMMLVQCLKTGGTYGRKDTPIAMVMNATQEALEQRDQVLVVVLQPRPAVRQRRHQDLDVPRVLQCGVRERPDGIVQDEHVLVLVLVECLKATPPTPKAAPPPKPKLRRLTQAAHPSCSAASGPAGCCCRCTSTTTCGARGRSKKLVNLKIY
ncbi:hypothetical protein C8J57DRAFT_1590757 [Mycena rebaudengoi]|nr:hypothetical protein C8J57DRAFT_1590757 [Mycena rebaudengoi]